MIDLAMLGIGGGMPLPGRYLSSALLNFNGRKILIDCGEGTQVSMRELGWGFKAIDIICITHGHGDHTVGLPGLLGTIGNSGRETPLTIIGPKGIEKIVNGLRVITPYLPYDINIIEATDSTLNFDIKDGELQNIDSNVKSFDSIQINTIELDHSIDCIAYSFNVARAAKFDISKAMLNNVPKNIWGTLQKGQDVMFEGTNYTSDLVLGKSRDGLKLTYVTDTSYNDKIVDFARNSNLLVSEGTYGDDDDMPKAIKNKHMTFREAATIAKLSESKELLLTHFSPSMPTPNIFINNAKDVFENTSVAETHIIKKLNFK